MTLLFKKLNFKEQKEIYVLNHPLAFESEMEAMKGVTVIKTSLIDCKDIEFILVFVKIREEIANVATTINKKLKTDGIIWFAYPKGTSKKYKAEISRDNGWEVLKKLGLETVRAVAIDEDWSALRFRQVEFVKKMTRNAN